MVQLRPEQVKYGCRCGGYSGTQQGLWAHWKHAKRKPEPDARCTAPWVMEVDQELLPSRAEAGEPNGEEVIEPSPAPQQRMPAAPAKNGKEPSTTQERMNVPVYARSLYDGMRFHFGYTGTFAQFIWQSAFKSWRDHGFELVLRVREPDGTQVAVTVPPPRTDGEVPEVLSG